MTNLNRSDDKDLLVALGHPMRRRILRELSGEKVISPVELSAIIGKPLSNISYHVRVLAECAAVTLVGVRPVKGSMQHFYCSAIEAPWARRMVALPEPRDKAAGERPKGSGT
jgi:DNA-binding transcriptional ArsR family regulator